MEAYLAFYAPDFEPRGGMDRVGWEAMRRERIARPSAIAVRVSDLAVRFSSPELAAVSFVQDYESTTLSDRVRKILELGLVEDSWRILRERVED